MVEAEPKVATPSRGSEACGGSRSAGSSGAVGARGDSGEAGGVRGNGDDEWVAMMWRPIQLRAVGLPASNTRTAEHSAATHNARCC